MELKDTVNYMVSENYVDRFLAEYYQALIRTHKLEKMLEDYENGTLKFTPVCSEEILQMQLKCMRTYVGILTERALVEEIPINFNLFK